MSNLVHRVCILEASGERRVTLRTVACHVRGRLVSLAACMTCAECKSVRRERDRVACAGIVRARDQLLSSPLTAPVAEMMAAHIDASRGDVAARRARASQIAGEMDPVVGSRGELLGVVRRSDLIGAPDPETPVASIARSVPTVESCERVQVALQRMARHGLRRLLVVEETGLLVGEIDDLTILAWIVRARRQLSATLGLRNAPC